MTCRFFSVILFFTLTGCVSLKETPLSPKLKESSALVIYKKMFLTINDSDNEPIIFIFDKKGKIVHETYVKNAINRDWEALAYDGKEYLYIGDIGNNRNNRKNLGVYKVKMEEVLQKDTIKAERISFSYPDQKSFPPQKEKMYYDAEAMVYKNGELFIFTKNRTVPFDGISKVYSVPITPENHKATFLYDLQLPATHWLEESITDASLFQDELFLLTYSKVYLYKWETGAWKQKKEWLHKSITQKEGIAVTKNKIFIVDEDNENFVDFYRQKGNFLYQIQKK